MNQLLINYYDNSKNLLLPRIIDLEISTKVSIIISRIISILNDVHILDQETRLHSIRVSILVGFFAKLLKLDNIFIDNMVCGGLLHDIGKIYIDGIHLVDRKLSYDEFETIKKHTNHGNQIVSNICTCDLINHKCLLTIKMMTLYHHEKYDGTGYPNGLKGEQIPLCVRIITIIDIFDALLSERSYKKSLSPNEAIVVMNSMKSAFDPELFKFFTIYWEDLLIVRSKIEL